MYALGQLPAKGQVISLADWHFQVIELEGRRIDKEGRRIDKVMATQPMSTPAP
jgi:CBS domain containing-hemolysin-like protein